MFNDNVLSVEDDPKDVEDSGLIIWNYYKVDGAQSKQGGAKYTPCISGFCDTSLTECSDYCSPSKAFCRSPISLVKQFSQLWTEQTYLGEH